MEIHWSGLSPRHAASAALPAQRSIIPYALLVGLIGGLVGAAYVSSMKLLQMALWPDHWQSWFHLFILVLAGCVVAVGTRWIGPSGDVELLVDNVHVAGGAEDLRGLRSLIPISLICIASGGGMGPEAPLVQTGGSLGSWVGRRFHLDRVEMRTLTITGMAAAFTVLFGTPLGSAIFALELLHKRGLEYYEALIPAVIGSVIGFAIYLVITGLGLSPIWNFPATGALHDVDILWAIGCGVVGALVAIIFTYLTEFLRAVFRRVPAFYRPIIGGLVLGLLAFASPYALTFGEAQINPLTVKSAAALFFLGAAAAKMAGTSITLSSTWKGGFIIPLFFMGVALGRFGHALFPGSNVVVLMAALMAANNVGVTKTPLGSVLVVSGMAGLKILPTTLLAALIALFLTSNVGLIESPRERDRADEPAV
jgi:H+/Cl- antiporter ClcA